jgi:hypothetical protein
MPQPIGRKLPLSLPRRYICDLLHFARHVPSVPVQRRLRLAAVAAARELAHPRPTWCALFTKAYARASAANPHLRRAYVGYPWPHLYEHPQNIATLAIERIHEGEDALFFAPLPHPETLSLHEIDARLRYWQETSIDEVDCFRRVLRFSQLPRPLRRLAGWLALRWSGRRRARWLGTFGVQVRAGIGAATTHPLARLTTTLCPGEVDERGEVDVRLLYDHRVLDGGTAARALAELERVLTQEILAELRYCQGVEAA